MPVTITVDLDSIYAMLKEYYDAVMADRLPDIDITSTYLAILQDDTVKYRAPLSCSVSLVPGGVKMVCIYSDTTSNAYTANGAAFRFDRWYGGYHGTTELFKVGFPSATKSEQDILHITATAVVTVG